MRKYRLKQITFLDGFALGAFCAAEVFLVVFMMLDWPLKSDAWVGFVGSIVVAGFSIGAAYIALRGNRTQISQTNDIEDERRHNKLVAARAILPAILSELSIVARNNLMLRFHPGHTPVGFHVPHPTAFQALPDSIIPDLKECIEHADSVSQDRLANILKHFQVQQARQAAVGIGVILPHITGLTAATHDAISDAIGWAVVYGLVGEAFSYARGTANSIPPRIDPETVRGAFTLAGVVTGMYPNVDQLLELRIAGDRLERQW
ncbi:hypothetical protein ABLE86_20755 [Mesorhizobium sp. KR2-14]